MTFVIDGTCCKDASCVEVCPAQCIHPRPGESDFETADQLYIDPRACIGCGACVIECPVGAISHEDDLFDADRKFIETNALYFVNHPTPEPVSPFENGWIVDAPRRDEVAVAVVGAGAAGCYMAAELSDRGFSVDLFEKNDRAFGLIREGVAPDHLNTKSIRHMFRSVLRRKNVSVYSQVTVGESVSIARLRECYNAVIWAAGANLDRRLLGEARAMEGVLSGREFARWLNLADKWHRTRFSLQGPNVAIIGMGNVALDAARAVLAPDSAFEGAEMPPSVRRSLAAANIREVRIVARGPADRVSFSFSQLHSLLCLPDVQLYVHDLLTDDAPVALDMRTAREADTVFDVLAPPSLTAREMTDCRKIVFQFNSALVDIVGDGKIRGVRFSGPFGAAGPGIAPDAKRGASLEYPVGTLIVAVGQACAPSDDINSFKLEKMDPGIPLNLGFENAYLRPGLYEIGWSRRNGHGVIGTSKVDARAVANHLVACLEAGQLPSPVGDRNELTAPFREIGVMPM